jgi:hypothetical protein
MIDERRLARERCLVEHGLFGISAAADGHHTQNLIADFESRRLRSAFLDDARYVPPERVRQSVLLDGRVLTVADLEIDGIDARGLHGDEHLPGIRQ